MKNLFVIGNGFDCYEHNLPTMYKDFRDYIISRFTYVEDYYEYVPSSMIMPDGSEYTNPEDSAGYITRIIDECGDERWSALEYYLGSTIFTVLDNEFETVDWDGEDKEIRHVIYNNEDMSSDIRKTFVLLKDLFYDWIRDELGRIDYTNVSKVNIASVLKDSDGFLNFNYTKTLETAYKIQASDVCHIHGVVGDKKEDIFFGHGDDSEIKENTDKYGSHSELVTLKSELKKDTETALKRNYSFFKKMEKLESVHSFGFSFSDVDMIYIKEIARRCCSDSKKVSWYLNTFDGKCIRIRQLLTDLGFEIRVDSRW